MRKLDYLLCLIVTAALYFAYSYYWTAPPQIIDMSSHAKALVVPALKRHTATVIVAHGLGDR